MNVIVKPYNSDGLKKYQYSLSFLLCFLYPDQSQLNSSGKKNLETSLNIL